MWDNWHDVSTTGVRFWIISISNISGIVDMFIWQTVQIQISWLLKKPTDLDRHCLQRQGVSGCRRTRVKRLRKKQSIYTKYWDRPALTALTKIRCQMWHLIFCGIWSRSTLLDTHPAVFRYMSRQSTLSCSNVRTCMVRSEMFNTYNALGKFSIWQFKLMILFLIFPRK